MGCGIRRTRRSAKELRDMRLQLGHLLQLLHHLGVVVLEGELPRAQRGKADAMLQAGLIRSI